MVAIDLLDMAVLRLTLAPAQHHLPVGQEHGRCAGVFHSAPLALPEATFSGASLQLCLLKRTGRMTFMLLHRVISAWRTCSTSQLPLPLSSGRPTSSSSPTPCGSASPHTGTISGLPRGNFAIVSVFKFNVWATISGGVWVIQSDKETSRNCGALNTSRTSRSVSPVFLM